MNEKQTTAVADFESRLRSKLCRENEDDFIFSDLTGLYVDIIGEIYKTNRERASIIHEYAKLLEDEFQFYSGAEAYIAGLESQDKPLHEVLSDYMRGIAEIKSGQNTDNAVSACADEIAALLGDKNDLVADFTEAYSKVHGVIKNNIHEFILLGQGSRDISVI